MKKFIKFIAWIGIIASISAILFGFIAMPKKYIEEDYGLFYERYSGGSVWSENYAYPYINNDASNWTIESNLRAARYTVCNNYVIGGFIGLILSGILIALGYSTVIQEEVCIKEEDIKSTKEENVQNDSNYEG